jgi:hypothetical protein
MNAPFWFRFLVIIVGIICLSGPGVGYGYFRLTGGRVPKDVRDVWIVLAVLLFFAGAYLLGKAFDDE